MANLFWKGPDGTRSLLATPFQTEEEFERTVFNTPDLLEDLFLLKRQVRGGSKAGIPDVVGIDSDGNVCIVELKNVAVDAAIIPQVLQYAFWAETNPDSIKSLWLEAEEKPEDISISWESFDVRIVVIAPEIRRSTLDIVEKINYPVDLVEVKRWVEGGNSFLLVNKLEPEERPGHVKPVRGLETYDAEFYRREYNKWSADEFLRFVSEVEKVIRGEEWALETKYNKHYCSFKAGFFNAFGIKWVGTKTFAFFFKLPEDRAAELDPRMTRYEKQWKEAVYYIEPGKTKTKDYLPLMQAAYARLTGD